MAEQNKASAANLNPSTEPEERMNRGEFFSLCLERLFFFSLFHANNSDDSYSAYSHSRKDKQENAPLESRCNKIA